MKTLCRLMRWDLMGEIRKLVDEKRSVEEKSKSRDAKTEFRVEAIDSVVRNLEFVHRSSCKEAPRFSIQRESEGTIAWLSLIVPALDVLRSGGLFCVDEIDASLHSHLVGTLIGFFADPNINHHAAQLVFTSHDTYLLSPLSEINLEPEQIWFTDKDNTGATELICLADFPRHKDANVAKRSSAGPGTARCPAPLRVQSSACSSQQALRWRRGASDSPPLEVEAGIRRGASKHADSS